MESLEPFYLQQLPCTNSSTNTENIFVLTMNYPKTRNAFGIKTFAAFTKCLFRLQQMSKETPKLAVILRSTVPGIFCAGADLKERINMSVEETASWVKSFRDILMEFENIGVLVIAVMDGNAFGGGLELALACDIRIAATNTKFGLPETKLGVIPGGGGTQRLPRIIGVAKAKELIFTGRLINDEEALAVGLVNQVVTQNDNGDAAFQQGIHLCRSILDNCAPLAIEAAKLAINIGSNFADLRCAMTVEELCYNRLLKTEDRDEGLFAFKEKRKPYFVGK